MGGTFEVTGRRMSVADRLDTSVNQRFSSRLGVLLSCVGIAIGTGYLFTPQWSQLAQPKIWMEALTQNAWDTGAGWGLFLTYAWLSSANGTFCACQAPAGPPWIAAYPLT